MIAIDGAPESRMSISESLVWPMVRLSDGLISNIQTGFACGNHNQTGDGIAHVRPFNVSSEGAMDFSTIKFVPTHEANKPERLLQFEDVVFNNTNSPELVGKTAIYLSEESTAFSNRMSRLRVNRERIRPRFLALALHQLWREGFFADNCNNHVSQASISRAVLLDIEIALPEPEAQDQLVALIEDLQLQVGAVRERLVAIPALLKKFRQSVLATACSGRLTADWRHANQIATIDSEAGAIARLRFEWSENRNKQLRRSRTYVPAVQLPKDDELFEIPTSWRWMSADEVCFQVTDGEHIQPGYRKDGLPMLSAKHVRDGYVDAAGAGLIATADFEKCLERCAPQRNDLLIVSVGATTGRAGLVTIDEPFAIVRSVLLLKPIISPMFLLRWTQSLTCFRWMGGASGASAQPHFYISDCKGMPVPVPPSGEQAEIVRRVESLFALADSIESRLAEATARVERTTQTILSKAFSGELIPRTGRQ